MSKKQRIDMLKRIQEEKNNIEAHRKAFVGTGVNARGDSYMIDEGEII